MTIIGIMGAAGSGKDTVAGFLAPRHLVWQGATWRDVSSVEPTDRSRALAPRSAQLAFADPMKVFCQEVYDFSDLQLWGPSSHRNKPDERWLREYATHVWRDKKEPSLRGNDINFGRALVCVTCGKYTAMGGNIDGPCVDYLTPREALQQLGTEWGRCMHPDTWVRKTLAYAVRLTAGPRYLPAASLHTHSSVIQEIDDIVISDVRFPNECELIRDHEGFILEVVRPGVVPLPGVQHASETEREQIVPDIQLDNDGTLDDLRQKLQELLHIA